MLKDSISSLALIVIYLGEAKVLKERSLTSRESLAVH